MIVLDTHVLLWWTQQPELISRKALAAIERADQIIVPSIVFWEAALLVRKRRFALKRAQTVLDWTQAVLSIPRVIEAPLTAELAVRADGLPMHSDPADRFIVATALQLRAPLVTKDSLLRELSAVRAVW